MMGVYLSNKDISLFVVNVILWLSAMSYTMLFGLGEISLELSDIAIPEAGSGIYVIMMFARFCMIAAVFIVFVYDAMYGINAIKKYYKEKNKGWL
jgi:hypothetical protein